MEKKTEALSVSSGENILRYEGEISSLWSTRNLKKTPSAFLFFLFWCSCSLSQVFSANSHFFYMKTIYFETSKFEGKGMREGPKAAVLFELSSARAGSWLGSAGFLSVTASASSIHQWAKHKTLGVKLTFKDSSTNRASWCASSADTATMWPQHRVMPCALRILTC